MGCICGDKKENQEKLKTNQPKLSSAYQTTENSFKNNGPNIYIPSTPKNPTYPKPPRVTKSYGLSSGKMREQSLYNKNLVTKNDFMNMKKYYFNLITLMGGGVNKKTIGQGGQIR